MIQLAGYQFSVVRKAEFRWFRFQAFRARFTP